MDIRTVCLGILSFEDASGYDIKQRFERVYSHFFAAGYGSIYPALAELAAEGLVTCREEPGGSARPRKVYSLTAAGRRTLAERLEAAEPRHRVHSDFALLMFLAELMEPERVAEMIERRLADIRAHLARLAAYERDADGLPPGVEFTRGLGVAVLDATARYLEQRRGPFLDALRARRALRPDLPQQSLSGDPA